jgi:gliding motility-associated-like protein
MKKFIAHKILLFSLFLHPILFSQNEANIWYFGYNAGLDFNTEPPTPLSDGMLSTYEGCTTVSNSQGQLLFYTDGMTVYNRNHQIMSNGSGLLGNSSATQSGIVVPFPGTFNTTTQAFDKYFIVTIDQAQGPNGVRFSELDMTLNAGLGDITATKNIFLYGSTTTEKICVAKHSNGCDFWVIGKPAGLGEFYSYPITSSGFNTTPVVSTVPQAYGAWSGSLKSSPDNKLIAVTHGAGNGLFVYDFDNATGILTEKFTDYEGFEAYGVEFSPNSKMLYYTNIQGWNIFQYKLDVTTNTDFVASKQIIGTTTNPFSYHVGALQLAPNGKIYVALPETNALGVIESPNVEGVASTYLDLAQNLGGRNHYLGLPAFVTSLVTGNGFQFQDTSICSGEPLTFPNPGTNGYWTNANNDIVTQPLNSSAGTYTFYPDCGSPSEWKVEINTCGTTISGIINKYTSVVAINNCDKSITVQNASEFNVGDRVLLIQMKGAEINTDNASTFGDVSNYGNSGNYEFGTIETINGNTVTLVNSILREYTISGLVQLVFVPHYSQDVIIENTLTCEHWNGITGGILIFETDGSVIMNADIDASDKGFRAGVFSYNGGVTCGLTDYYFPITSFDGGRKGEGIHNLSENIINGRGKNANGGGGGNNSNAGGGGGSNYGLGGIGGQEYIGCPNSSIVNNGGLGGTNLTYTNSINKIFLGGGGGGGQQNDNLSTPGTNGGGIVIIKSNAIISNNREINSFSSNSISSYGDGAGGGGGGGTVLLTTSNITGNLKVDVHGGNGGNCTNGTSPHGTGGGGGGGVIWSSSILPPNVILDIAGGQAGLAEAYNYTYGTWGAGSGEYGGRIVGLVLPESTSPLQNTFVGDTSATACQSFTWYGTTYNQSGDYTHTLQSVNGCDSIVTLHLSINSSISTIDSQNACESFTWIDGNTYTQSTNTPSVTLQSVLGCDSIVTLNLTIFNAVTRDTNVVACENFTWNGTNYSSSGTYSQSLQTVHGCDSLVNLNLTINQTSDGDTTTSACTSFSWYGNSYSNSGDYQHILTNSVGCDSTVTLHLTIFPTSSSDTSATACESFTWYGTTYNQSGTYSHLLQTINGCDSTVNLNLSILNSNASIDTQSACESFTWIDGNTYTQSTSTPSVTLQSVLGCDSIVTLNLTIFNAVTRDTNVVACENFTWNGTNYSNSGTYSQSFQTINGCDSLVNLNLTINQTSIGDTTASACSSFSWYGNSYSNSGDFQHILTNSVGCDSTVTLHLTIFQTSSSDTSATACESFTWYGTTYNQSGTYSHLLQTINGCDSTVNLNLTINQVVIHEDIIVSWTGSYTWIDGITYTNSNNTASFTFPNAAANGCDSIVTLDLFVGVRGYDTIIACDNYTWIDGITYSQSTNTPEFTFPNGSSLGADSVSILVLTINQSSSSTDVQSACLSYTWMDGNTYTSSTNAPTFTLQNAVGCDSIITLNLTIFNPTIGDTSASACETFTWYGNTYAASGDYSQLLQSQNGCDSTVILHLTIHQATFGDSTAISCGAFTWYGNNYPNSGTYTHLLQNMHGCDSLVSLNLTVNEFQSFDVNLVSCGTHTWNGINYESSGTYTQSFPIGEACDSIVNLNLTVIPKPIAQFSTDKLETDIVNPSILFENQSENAISYLWNLGDGVSSVEVDLEHSYSEPNNYTIRLIAYATEDCTDTAFVTIKVTNVPIYYVPNSFTPNGDELNNTFKPIFGPNFTPKDYEFRIYNRWGEVLFVSFDPLIGWDGTYLELGLVQNGVYTYQINFLSNEQELIKLTGTVNLIR